MFFWVQVRCFAHKEEVSDNWTALVLINSSGDDFEFDQQLFGDLK